MPLPPANENVEVAKGLREMMFPVLYFEEVSEGLTDPEDLARLKAIVAKRKATG